MPFEPAVHLMAPLGVLLDSSNIDLGTQSPPAPLPVKLEVGIADWLFVIARTPPRRCPSSSRPALNNARFVAARRPSMPLVTSNCPALARS
ncbi:hypothetical protein AURDEDRAFT_157898 [Auricularia subglabra TFB-10046 SS5]|nr:hypothetical protein AURDEDRAFT_157898 [Auricularia subglabra TFB-10046 SS5]